MRKPSAFFIIMLLAALAGSDAGRDAVAMDLAKFRPVESAGPLLEVKLKCGFQPNGKFACKNVPDTNKGNNQGSGSGAAKCRGKNSCPPGYRDLDFPNKYGACCEQVAVPAKPQTPQTPTSGGCRAVEKMSQMSCSPPFSALSCGPLQNGRMTCCCVK